METKSVLYKCLLCLLFLPAILCPAAIGKIIYVDDDAPVSSVEDGNGGLNDGSSWENAYVYLQDALADANDSNKPVEIRVAAGTYKSDQGAGQTPGDRNATFQLINGVTLKGGYAGLGQYDPNARDIELYQTILSGDLDGNDIDVNTPGDLLDEPTRLENSYHVVTSNDIDDTAVLDGFTITAGNANGTLLSGLDRGGGMYIYDSNLTVTNCIFNSNSAEFIGGGAFNIFNNNYSLENCIFSGNAASHGGGMFDCQSNPALKNCSFDGNSAIYEGGGMYNEKSKPTITNCTFSENTALDSRGGGMKNYCTNPMLTNCIFSENVSGYAGGGINNYHSEPVLIDCIFSWNMAMNDGGGMYSDHDSNSTLINCSFSDNSSKRMGGGIYNSSSDLKMNTCSFSRNQAGSDGGGVEIFGGNTKLTNCSFNSNRAGTNGGGMDNTAGNAMLTDCTFSDNYAEVDGGGINNYSINHTLINCIFSKNVAGEDGGGMKNLGSNPVLVNCSFSRNFANYGGGMYNDFYSYPSLNNCIFSENSAEYGGGIYDDDNNNSIIYKCTFRKNNAWYGGGVFSRGWANKKNELNLTECNFIGNCAKYGGGMNNSYVNLKLANCTFIGNCVSDQGGGMDNTANCDLIIVNCTFTSNLSPSGNAICCSSEGEPSVVELTNCIIWDDNNGIWNSDGSTITVTYCDIKGNQTNIYDPCETVIWDLGNIDSDPCFADPGYWDPNGTPNDPNDDSWVDGDYHLKSQVGRYDPNSGSWVLDDVTSPCIDTGDPNSPVYYEQVPNGGIINMGAYGGLRQTSMSLYDVNMILDRANESIPANGVTDVALDVLLYWVSDENIVTHEVYFGEDNPPPFVRKQYESTFDPGALAPNTQYYWRIDDIDNLLNRITGHQWAFCTGPQPSYAYNPSPIDGTDNVEFGAILTWNPGLNAIAHNVYLGADYNNVYDATIESPLGVLVSVGQDSNSYYPGRLEFNQTYYWRIDEINNQDVITAGNVWMFVTGSQPVQAYNPFPANKAVNVELDTSLSWSAGVNAVSHDVYLGTNFNDVNDATSTNPLGVLISEGQDANSYDPNFLRYNRIYYWRIDEVNGQGNKTTGDIWVFTTYNPPPKGCACFIGETSVWVDGKLVPISKVAALEVISSIEGQNKVEVVQVHNGTFTCYDISLDSGKTINVAENHYFMTESGQWLSLHNLKAGTRLKTSKGTVGLKSIKKRPEPYIGKVYNLKVKDSDQYLVGEDAIIVRDY